MQYVLLGDNMQRVLSGSKKVYGGEGYVMGCVVCVQMRKP